MSQDFSLKQQNWVRRFSQGVVSLLSSADALSALCTEYTAEAYGTGGENALTDTVVQTQLPAATAQVVWSAEGAIAGSGQVLANIASNRGYLEALRP